LQKKSRSGLSLNDLLERLCPELRRHHWRAAIKSSQAIVPQLHQARIRSTIARLEARGEESTQTIQHALKITHAEAVREAKTARRCKMAALAAKQQKVLSDALRDGRYLFTGIAEDGSDRDIQARSADRCRWHWGNGGGFVILSPVAPGSRETILHDVRAEPAPAPKRRKQSSQAAFQQWLNKNYPNETALTHKQLAKRFEAEASLPIGERTCDVHAGANNEL
jgi:hypothetical protein